VRAGDIGSASTFCIVIVALTGQPRAYRAVCGIGSGPDLEVSAALPTQSDDDGLVNCESSARGPSIERFELC
jgi:hypothetical protein